MERLLANEPEPEPLPEELQPRKPEDHNQNNLKNHSQNLKSHNHDKQAMRYLTGAIVGHAELRQSKKIASAVAQIKRHASFKLDLDGNVLEIDMRFREDVFVYDNHTGFI